VVPPGRLPALATLSFDDFTGLAWGEGRSRLVPALEAVAGTLRRLDLAGRPLKEPPVEAYQKLGTAIGKLRRLRYLELGLLTDGCGYQPVRAEPASHPDRCNLHRGGGAAAVLRPGPDAPDSGLGGQGLVLVLVSSRLYAGYSVQGWYASRMGMSFSGWPSSARGCGGL
jgi:hypothetical protein